MESEFTLPFFAQIKWILLVFVASLIVFDLVLVRWKPLSKKAWKRVDYVWLAVGALGLVSAVQGPRELIIGNFLPSAENRLDSALLTLQSSVRFGHSELYCRKFGPIENTARRAELERIQSEYKATCEWFIEISSLFPKKVADLNGPISLDSLPKPPETNEEMLRTTIEQVAKEISRLNDEISILNRLKDESKRTLPEDIMKAFGPLLLALALALRITKVTGEVMHER